MFERRVGHVSVDQRRLHVVLVQCQLASFDEEHGLVLGASREGRRQGQLAGRVEEDDQVLVLRLLAKLHQLLATLLVSQKLCPFVLFDLERSENVVLEKIEPGVAPWPGGFLFVRHGSLALPGTPSQRSFLRSSAIFSFYADDFFVLRAISVARNDEELLAKKLHSAFWPHAELSRHDQVSVPKRWQLASYTLVVMVTVVLLRMHVQEKWRLTKFMVQKGRGCAHRLLCVWLTRLFAMQVGWTFGDRELRRTVNTTGAFCPSSG